MHITDQIFLVCVGQSRMAAQCAQLSTVVTLHNRVVAPCSAELITYHGIPANQLLLALSTYTQQTPVWSFECMK